MRHIKEAGRSLSPKDAWISGSISGFAWIIFIFLGGYIAFIATIHPWWWKLVILSGLAVGLFILCGVVDRAVFRKLGRKSPKS